MNHQSVDLAALHEAIKTQIRAQYPVSKIKTVDYYARAGAAISCPAIYFELDDIEPGEDNGNEQLDVKLNFAAYCVVSFKDKGAAQVAVRLMALALAAFIRGKQFGQPVGGAKIESIVPAEFRSSEKSTVANPSYFTFLVAWSHEALAGDGIPDSGAIPSEVWIGFDPDTGPEHVADYLNLDTLKP